MGSSSSSSDRSGTIVGDGDLEVDFPLCCSCFHCSYGYLSFFAIKQRGILYMMIYVMLLVGYRYDVYIRVCFFLVLLYAFSFFVFVYEELFQALDDSVAFHMNKVNMMCCCKGLMRL